MKKDEVREAYKEAIGDGYTHASIARATGIHVSSLKNFHDEIGGFGPELVSRLEEWLAPRGFMNGTWVSRDPFHGLIAGLRGIANEIEAEASFEERRRILQAFATRLASHSALIGLENTNKAGKE